MLHWSKKLAVCGWRMPSIGCISDECDSTNASEQPYGHIVGGLDASRYFFRLLWVLLIFFNDDVLFRCENPVISVDFGSASAQGVDEPLTFMTMQGQCKHAF